VGFDLRFRRDAFVNVGTESETEVIMRWMVEDAHLLRNSDLPEEPGMFDVFRMIKQRKSVHAISDSAAEVAPTRPLMMYLFPADESLRIFDMPFVR
jgi:hypothetical protein